MTRPRLSFLVILLTFTLTALAGCESDERSPTPPELTPTPTPTLRPHADLHTFLGEPFEMRLPRYSAYVGDEFRVDFKSILADSRCPIDAACLVPNLAIIELGVLESTSSTVATHQVFFDSGASVTTIGGYDIQVLALEPAAAEVTSPTDYRLTLLVTETPSLAPVDVDLTISTNDTTVGAPITIAANLAGTTHTQYMLLVEQAVVSVVRHDGTQVRGSQTPVIELRAANVHEGVSTWSIVGMEPDIYNFRVIVSGEAVDGSSARKFIRASREFTITIE